MKKIVPIVMIALMVLSILASVPIRGKDTCTIYVALSSIVDPPLVPGSTFDIDINILDVFQLYVWGFYLCWDPTTLLEATNVQEGDFLDQDTYNTIFQPYYYSDHIMVVCTLQGEPRSASASGNGTLATVTFNVKGEGNTTLDLYNTDLRDYDNNQISHGTEDGYFDNTLGPMKIGVIGPVGWPQGDGMWEGAMFATDEINAMGGVDVGGAMRQIELVSGNEIIYPEPDPSVAAIEMERLITVEGVDFVIGGLRSENVFAMREMAMDYQTIFMITGAATDELIDCGSGTCGACVRCDYERYKYTFRVAPLNETTQFLSLATFLSRVIPVNLLPLYGEALWLEAPNPQVRVAVITEDLDWTIPIHEALTNPAIYPTVLGPYANVTYQGRIPDGTTDCSPWLQDIIDSKARLLIHVFSGFTGVHFITQWRDMEVEAVPVGINELSQMSTMWDLTTGNCEYETILAVSGEGNPINSRAVSFYGEILSRYGHVPIYTSYGAYDAIYTLKEAIEAAGTLDADTVVTELEQTDLIGTRGRFKFTEHHDVFCSEIGANWEEGYVRPLFVQWQKNPRTEEARIEVVYPIYDRAASFAKKWKIPSWIYPLANTDLDLDGDVDIFDVSCIAVAYGTIAGDPRWDPDADIDGNRIINTADICRVAKDFGKSAMLPLPLSMATTKITPHTPATIQSNSRTTVYLDPLLINGTTIGEEFTVNLMIRDAVEIYGWQAGIAFNATFLECTELYAGEFIQNVGGPFQWVPGEINNTLGVITPYACSLMGDYYAIGDGRLAYATFRVKAPGISNLHLRDIMVIDYYNPLFMVQFDIIDVYTVTHSPAETTIILSNSTGVETDGYNFVDGEPVLIKIGSGFYGHGFSYPEQKLSFNVTGPYPGFSNIIIPKTLLNVSTPDHVLVTVDNEHLGTGERIVTENLTHYSIYINYTVGEHNICSTKRPSVYNNDTCLYYPTIQGAINAANTGETIFAYNGTYYENVVVNKSISLIGENKYNTIIDANLIGTVINIEANNVTITGFTIQNSGNPEYGILVDGSSNSNISHNIITKNEYGILLDSSSNNTLTNNTMFDNKYNFGLYGATETHFDNTIDESNTVDGKPVYYVKKASDTVYDPSTNAGTFYLIDCTNITLRNLTLTKNVNGIFLWNTTGSMIENVTASNNFFGIHLHSSNNSVIYHNSFIENTIQVNVIESHDNLWDNGYPSGGNYWSEYIDIDFYHGPYQNETGNDGIWDWGYKINPNNTDNYPLISPLTHPVYNIDSYLGYTRIQEAINSSQTLDMHTIIVRAGTYYEHVAINKSLTLIGIMGSTIIDGNGAGTVVTVTANDVTLRGFTIRGSDSTDHGIHLSHSNSTDISRNIITNNGYGIWLDYSNDCIIRRNDIRNNTEEGIELRYSDGNRIYDNNMTFNNYGIYLEWSNDNIIYHNNFINNTEHAHTHISYYNEWNQTYPSGGNYWSDYEERYPDAEELDGSGIWNTPYVIDENNIDEYPLMEPWKPIAITILGDVDGDYDVDSMDLFTLAPAYGTEGPPKKDPPDDLYNSRCDFDKDGDVDSMDLFTLAPNYGKTA